MAKPSRAADSAGEGLSGGFLALAVAAAAAFVVLAALHASAYFFLYDDYAVVGVPAREPLATLLASPVGGFWRPAALLWMRLEAGLLGFGHPAGHAAVSAGLHLLAAALAGLLARRLAASARAGAVAFALFAASPWAGEAYFWLSARFELLCAVGVLGSLLAGLRYVETGRSAGALLALAAGAGALLAKEMAVTLPVLFAFFSFRPSRPGSPRRAALLLAALVTLVGAYLLLRSRVVPALGGAYGGFGELLGRTDLPSHAASYARAVLFPFPGPHASVAGAASALHGAALGLLALLALRRRPALALLSLLAFAVSLVPVIWSALPAGSTASGRYAYLPGAFAALLAAAGVAPPRAAPAAATGRLGLLVSGGLLAAALVLVDAQRRAWGAASSLARAGVEAMRPVVGKADRLYVPNLPAGFAEGPYVLKPYALRFYFGVDRPTVRAEAVTLTLRSGRPEALSSEPDPLSEHAAGQPETVLVLPAPLPPVRDPQAPPSDPARP